MKKYFVLFGFAFVFVHMTIAQTSIEGHVYYMNSKFETGELVPVANVQIRATGSHGGYSKSNGEYQLIFSQYPVGKVITLGLGNENNIITNGDGKQLEWVNQKGIETNTIPADPKKKPIDIIVCLKGYRDLAAQRYYNIFKTSADNALAQKEKELTQKEKEYQGLLTDKNKDTNEINKLREIIQTLRIQNDSIYLYSEALRIASINKDYASERILKYLNQLDSNTNVREALKELNIVEAKKEALESAAKISDSIEELEMLVDAYRYIGDNIKVAESFSAIVEIFEMIDTEPWKISLYSSLAALFYDLENEYELALHFYFKEYALYNSNYLDDPIRFANCCIDLAQIFSENKQYKKCIFYAKKGLKIYKQYLKPKSRTITDCNSLLIGTHNRLIQEILIEKDNEEAILYLDSMITIQNSSIYGFRYPYTLFDSYYTKAICHYEVGEYKKAIKSFEKADECPYAETMIHYGFYSYLGRAYLKKGKKKKALKYFLLADHPSYEDKALSFINWVMYYSICNDRIKAIKNLKDAVINGFNDLEWIENETSINSIRDEPEFVEIIEMINNNDK